MRRVTVALMRRLLLLLVLAVALGGGATGCGESGPSGPDAKAVEEFEDLGLGQEKAESEVDAANKEAAKQIRKDKARLQREIRGEEVSSSKQKSKPKKQTPAQTAGFHGKYEEAYELGLFACGFHPLEQIAKEFNISPSSNELEVAEAYAGGYYGRFEQAAFEGCFEGIRKRQTE
jgi:predicted small lipoprotein YifL